MARRRSGDDQPPPQRSDAAERIARQWDAARQRNPKLTPGDWAQRVFPPRLDPETGQPVARSKRGAAATLRAILEGRADDAADAILERTVRRYKLTVGGRDASGNVVWVTNVSIDTGQPPGEISDTDLLALIQEAYSKGIGSAPRHAVQGEPPITHAEVFRVPGQRGGWVGAILE